MFDVFYDDDDDFDAYFLEGLTSGTARKAPLRKTKMNPDLLRLFRDPWTVSRRPAGDLVSVVVETEPDGLPVCTVGVLCGDRRADALTAAVARALAALPRLCRALEELADLDAPWNGPALRALVRGTARQALSSLESHED